MVRNKSNQQLKNNEKRFVRGSSQKFGNSNFKFNQIPLTNQNSMKIAKNPMVFRFNKDSISNFAESVNREAYNNSIREGSTSKTKI
jgi:hypothetical protein